MSLTINIIKAVEHSGLQPLVHGADKDIEGDLCDLYRCTQILTPPKAPVVETPEPVNVWERLMGPVEDAPADPGSISAFVKVPRYVLDNDLVRQESSILTHLWQGEEQETRFLRYLPRLMASFTTDGLHCNVVKEAVGYVTLEEVMRAYPNGLDYRDAAWMLKRVLSGIGYAHELGVIHGALVPSNILVHPTGHGAKLIDWCYSVRLRDRMSIRAYVAACKDMYAPEVFEKQFPSPATDIYMIGRCFQVLLGEAAPPDIRALLTRCTSARPGDRPQEAWALHDEFDAILQGLVGKPAYRPLVLPG